MEVNNFKKIIDHLASFSSEERGKIFERYCKWFLENDPRYSNQLKKVWLWKDWPHNWGRDKGIDLIAETFSGSIWAIQVKAYDEIYSVTKEDIDKFLSETSRKAISFRLLIATTNTIGSNAQEVINGQEKPVGLCLLDQLEKASLDWSNVLTNSKVSSKRKTHKPYPHQDEAIQGILKGFENSDRGQIHMACGTGKTLVGLWVAEKLNAQKTLVLVPSISLVSQLYSEWANNSSEKFNPLFVCSDVTVGNKDEDAEEVVENAINLGFPVTTNAAELLEQLNSDSGRVIIFSTYHSSPVIKEACKLDPAINFDLVIADEAHRCAGKTESYFATIVNRDVIRASKKLFMTATPKFFSENVKKKTKELECEIVSMDDTEKFGPVFYKLPFSEAIKRELLSDYQVLISVMDNKTYQEYAERGRFVTINDIETDARTLASQILIAKAIKRFGLKKIISFHNRKSNARDFINTFAQANDLIPENERPQVNFLQTIFGEMSQSKRDVILKQFKESTKVHAGLIANVKCLSEGVDVPALDGVAFIDPKGSEIDIIQSVGRAIRKSENKNIGTIIIPIFIDSATNEEEAFEQSCFKPIWKVLKALRAHDDILAEELDNIRLELGKRVYKAPQKLSKVIIDLPIGLDNEFVEMVHFKITHNIIEKCSQSWNFYMQLLREFRVINTCRWPSQYENFSGYKLGRWCSDQRKHFKKNLLENWKIVLLNNIDFSWRVWTDYWQKQFNYLKEFRNLNPTRWPGKKEQFPKDNKLGVWYGAQQHRYKNKLLKDWQIKNLDDIGFPSDVFQTRWNKQFQLLIMYRLQNHNRWPTDIEEFPEGNRLGAWCSDQRSNFKTKSLKVERIKALESLGFLWQPTIDDWNIQLNYLKEFRNLYPLKWPKILEQFPENNKLGRWCSIQREALKKNLLSSLQCEELNNIGFVWNNFHKSWDRQFQNLLEFRKVYNSRWPMLREEFPVGNKLGYWCSDQRQKLKKNKLSPEKIKKLSATGFPWKY